MTPKEKAPFAGLLSGRRDSNSGPLVPQTSALTRLRHAPRRRARYQPVCDHAELGSPPPRHDSFSQVFQLFVSTDNTLSVSPTSTGTASSSLGERTLAEGTVLLRHVAGEGCPPNDRCPQARIRYRGSVPEVKVA